MKFAVNVSPVDQVFTFPLQKQGEISVLVSITDGRNKVSRYCRIFAYALSLISYSLSEKKKGKTLSTSICEKDIFN